MIKQLNVPTWKSVLDLSTIQVETNRFDNLAKLYKTKYG